MAYDFDGYSIRNTLNAKRIRYLYHANSVQTACTFLECGGLLSRGTVQDRGLKQTWQKSDATDKIFGIWYDIFLDDCDLHQQSNRINYYGPVLFVFNSDILLRSHLPKVRVTKSNPVYWKKSEEEKDWYFYDLQELNDNYNYGDFAQMITLRETKDLLDFGNSLIELRLDDPSREINGKNAFTQAIHALESAANIGGVNARITKRQCHLSCKCKSIYEEMEETWFARLYKP